MTNYYIGFDCGTMGTKVAIYADDSNLVAEAYRPHKIDFPKPGWAEMDPDQFYRCVVDGIKECVTTSGIDPKQVRGISCSGIVCGFVPIDENWDPTRPYICFLDTRAKKEAEQVANLDEKPWYDEAGNAEPGAYMPPMFMKWLLTHEQENMGRAKSVVHGAHYVLGRLGELSGKDAFTDWAHASGWIIGFDARKRQWSDRQFDALNIPRELIPKMNKPWDVVGELSPRQAEACGLVAGIPLVTGAGDVMQSNLGSGVIDIGMSSDVAGTASIFTFVAPDFKREVTDQKAILNSMGTLEDQYVYWSFIPAGGLSLRWFRDEVLMREGDEEIFKELDQMAAKVPLGSEMSLFFPYLQGRSNPSWPEASASFIGMHGSNNAGTMWRSMMESIAFEYLSWVSLMRGVGIDLEEVIGTGGGSKSKIWNQIKADVLDAPYTTLKRTEGAVLGNAVVAAYGVGDIPDIPSTIKQWLERKETFQPNAENTAAYRRVFEQREKILNGPLREVMRELGALHDA